MEEQIKLAARLYKCRDTAKGLHRENYAAKVAEYNPYIWAAMDKYKVNELGAVMKMVEVLEKAGKADGMAVMMLMAAVVELIEPSKP